MSMAASPLVLDSAVVQSNSLKEILREVFVGFRGITLSLKKLVFRPPFKLFYHSWSRFTEILERQKTEHPDAERFVRGFTRLHLEASSHIILANASKSSPVSWHSQLFPRAPLA